MVTHRFVKILMTSLMALAVFSSAGCGFKKIWGEGVKKVISLREKSSGPGCPSPDLVLRGTESESKETFDCLRKKMDGIWNQIQPSRPDVLNDQEIALLIRKGIIPVSGDVEKVIPKLFAAKQLLGFKNDINKAGVTSWLNWFEKSRAKARVIATKWFAHDGSLVYQDAIDAAAILSGAFTTMNWEMDSNDLGRHIIDILDIKNPYNEPFIQKAVLPAAKIARETLGMFCTELNRTDMSIWRTTEIATCLTRLASGLSPGAKWFEFIFNPTPSLTPQENVAVQTSLIALGDVVRDWLSDCNDTADPEKPCLRRLRDTPLTKLHTENFIALSKAMGAPPPENFIDDLELVTYFPGDSNPKEITAATLALFFSVVKDWQMQLLNGMPLFLGATAAHQCVNPNTTYWTECILPDYGPETRKKSISLDIALQVKNLHWGDAAFPMTGAQYSKIALYYAIGKVVINAFDGEKEGYIVVSAQPDARHPLTNSLTKLINAGVHALDTTNRLFANIQRQLRHEPLIQTTSSANLGKLNVEGLAKLATSGADLLVARAATEKSPLEAFVDKFKSAPSGATMLDQKAIAGIVTLFDGMGALKGAYFGIDSTTGLPDSRTSSYIRRSDLNGDLLINRAIFMNPKPEGVMAEIIKTQFPRTYQSCTEFGFERSCGIALDEIVPNAYGSSKEIHPSDVDIMTLTLAGVEGVFDTCDFNKDGRLTTWSNNTNSGFDELDCAVGRIVDIFMRLLDSNIIDWNWERKSKIAFWINIGNSMSIPRTFEKVVLARGTEDNAFLNGITWFLPKNKEATIGSLYGALAEFLNSKRTNAINKSDAADH